MTFSYQQLTTLAEYIRKYRNGIGYMGPGEMVSFSPGNLSSSGVTLPTEVMLDLLRQADQEDK